MSRLSELKKNRGANLKKLQEEINKSRNGGFEREVDERIWRPKFNKDKGKGTVIGRFLPSKVDDCPTFVKVMRYSFKGPGGNYFDLARQTIGEDDPVQIAAINGFRKAKAENDASLKDQMKKFLPQGKYYANFHIIEAKDEPEMEGKVVIYEFGEQIFKLIQKSIEPEFDDVDPIDPFDLWGGANFKIRMVGREIPDRNTGEKVLVPNYENSEFDSPSEYLDGDEDELEALIERTHDISEFIAPEFDDVDPIDPFDLWGGANFKIRMVGREIPDRNTGEKVLVPNYENSEFDSPSEYLDGDEDELEALIERTHDISEFIAPEKFKSFDEVAERFQKVMGKPYNWLSTDGVNEAVESTEDSFRKQAELAKTADAKPEASADNGGDDDTPPPFDPDPKTEDDDDDPVAKFRRLVKR